jgi:phosphoribosylformimino-5-aminoimidazole carboxamide ribotide isomerase
LRIWAAIDLREGGAVQLVGGDPEQERVRIPDPAAVAGRWLDAGFTALHVVDLDAALGAGDNRDAVAAIAEAASGRAALQVGGGIRDDDAIARTLGLGVDQVVVGTRAVEDRAWLEAAAGRYTGRLVVAADIRHGMVVSRGWTESTGRAAGPFITGLDPLPLAAVLVTDVGREGQETGIDTAGFRDLLGMTRHDVIAAGGIAGTEDLDALRVAGAAGAVLGMALYSGRLDPAEALEREDG